MRQITAERGERTDYDAAEKLGYALDQINGVLGLPLHI